MLLGVICIHLVVLTVWNVFYWVFQSRVFLRLCKGEGVTGSQSDVTSVDYIIDFEQAYKATDWKQ